MADDTQNKVQQNPGGYVGSDPPELVTKFTDEGIVVVEAPKDTPPPAEPPSAKAKVSLG